MVEKTHVALYWLDYAYRCTQVGCWEGVEEACYAVRCIVDEVESPKDRLALWRAVRDYMGWQLHAWSRIAVLTDILPAQLYYLQEIDEEVMDAIHTRK